MKVSELERLAANLNSEFDRDRVEAWEHFCDVAPKLVRRVIAAEGMAEAIRRVSFSDNGIELIGSLSAYEATK